MESSFSEKLKVILDLVYEQGIKDCNYSNEKTMEVDEGQEAIIDLVKDIVPKTMAVMAPEAKYWNACRQEILDKLNHHKGEEIK